LFQHNGITICHATGNEKDPFHEETVDADSILNEHGHAGHPDDIIPPFEVIENGVTERYPGQNMDTIYGDGFTGAEVLANHCQIPTSNGEITSSTETITNTITETTTETVTLPGTTIAVPGKPTTTEITVTETIPAVTETAPGETTTVTVPSGETTTVTLPTKTVTLPAVTETVRGETVERPPVTVTESGTTATITGGTTATVVTVTTPRKTYTEAGLLSQKHDVVTLAAPGRVVDIPSHTVRTIVKYLTSEKKVVVIVVHAAAPDSGYGKG
jgi:hypothetical protein